MRDDPSVSTNLALLGLEQQQKQYGYELNQKLTFFVIGIELVLCGYLLLYKNDLEGVQYGGRIFLIAGVAAIFGILWRFMYNETFHLIAKKSKVSSSHKAIQTFTYWTYVTLSLATFIGVLHVGYAYLTS